MNDDISTIDVTGHRKLLGEQLPTLMQSIKKLRRSTGRLGWRGKRYTERHGDMVTIRLVRGNLGKRLFVR